jgi:signal transduction histidine kinase
MVNIRRLLTAVMRAHTHLAEVPMHCQVDEAVPLKMIGDAMRLQQILANGLVNATKVSRCPRARQSRCLSAGRYMAVAQGCGG